MKDSTPKRLFSVPYDTTINPSDYLCAISEYKDNIDHIFFGMPSIGANYHNRNAHARGEIPSVKIINENENAKQFLKLSKGKMKRTLAVNNIYIPTQPFGKEAYAEFNIIPILEEYGVEGVILTDFDMAKHIHRCLPKVEICTSCNGFLWTKRQMDLWAEEAGATLFNPPREVLRMPRMLEYFRSTGYRLKYLLNECCMIGCTYCIQHATAVAIGDECPHDCSHGDPANFLRCHYVLPRWLDKLDDYIDVYKISGRMSSLEYITRVLKAYITGEDDIDMLSITNGGKFFGAKAPRVIANKIPDKLLTCECAECNKTCFVCDNLMKQLMDETLLTGGIMNE